MGDDPPFKRKSPDGPVSGNAAAVGLWPELYDRLRSTDETDRIAEIQPKFARDARAASPKEKALCAAIIAERGDGPAARPWKEADRIRPGVNRRLKADGYDCVKTGVIYGRLKKPHVLKERG
jgi:hypothetical protein